MRSGAPGGDALLRALIHRGVRRGDRSITARPSADVLGSPEGHQRKGPCLAKSSRTYEARAGMSTRARTPLLRDVRMFLRSRRPPPHAAASQQRVDLEPIDAFARGCSRPVARSERLVLAERHASSHVATSGSCASVCSVTRSGRSRGDELRYTSRLLGRARKSGPRRERPPRAPAPARGRVIDALVDVARLGRVSRRAGSISTPRHDIPHRGGEGCARQPPSPAVSTTCPRRRRSAPRAPCGRDEVSTFLDAALEPM